MRKILKGPLKLIFFVVSDKKKDKILDYLYPKTIQIINDIFGEK